jgi:hypothetical protein
MHAASAAASTVLPLSCRSCCRIGSMRVSAYHSVPSSAWTPREISCTRSPSASAMSSRIFRTSARAWRVYWTGGRHTWPDRTDRQKYHAKRRKAVGLWCKQLSDEGSCHDASVCFGRSIVQRTAFR